MARWDKIVEYEELFRRVDFLCERGSQDPERRTEPADYA